MTPDSPLPLFAGLGIELEYMLVSADTLDVLPRADELLRAPSGDIEGYLERGPLAWSNELVLHVIELKTNGPVTTLTGLTAALQEDLRVINERLQTWNGRLMPAGMHPWMDPHRETRLWPHDYNEVYEAFNRVFNCQGHGWSNLQSLHLNFPFADDAEFGRLHAAIRLVLPLLPALAASSPFVEGRATGWLDNRLRFYRDNCAKIPSITGRVIPEPVWTRAAYQREILERVYRDIAPYDPEGVLQHEWLNARGAIARFERNTIEIRLLDVQECPWADLAIAALMVATLRALVTERWSRFDDQATLPTAPLENLWLAACRVGGEAGVGDDLYRQAFGLAGHASMSVADLWRYLADTLLPKDLPENKAWRDAIGIILDEGCLARRLLRAAGPDPTRPTLHRVYGDLCDCLAAGRMFRPLSPGRPQNGD